eukprot:g9910.t1
MATSANTDTLARRGNGGQHCHRLSVESNNTYACWTSSNSGGDGSGSGSGSEVMSTAAIGTENAYRNRLWGVEFPSTFAVDDIGGGCRRDSLSSTSRSSRRDSLNSRSGSCGSCNCNALNSSRYSTRTSAPSPHTSESQVVHQYSPTRTPVSTTSPATGSFPFPSGRGGCRQQHIGGSNSGSPPRFTVDSPSGSCQPAPAAASSTVAAAAAGLCRGRFSLEAPAPPCCCSTAGRNEVFFPCYPPSPLSFRSESPDNLTASSGSESRPGPQRNASFSGGGMTAASVSGTSPPSSDAPFTTFAPLSSSSKAALPSSLSAARLPLATLSGVRREEVDGGGGAGGGGISSRGPAPSQQPRWSSSPSQRIAKATAATPAVAAVAAEKASGCHPSTTSDVSPHEGLSQYGLSPAASGVDGRRACPSPEVMAKRSCHNTSGMNDGVRRIGSIVEFGRLELRPAATRSPRRGISGISGGHPETSAAKRTRCSRPPKGAWMEDDDVPRGDHRRGGSTWTVTNTQPGDDYNSRGRGCDNGDQFCPILKLPSAATTAQDFFHASSRGDGRQAGGGGGGGGGRRPSADGWPSGMSDMLRSFGDIKVSSHGDMPADSSGGRVLPRTRALRSRRSFADVTATCIETSSMTMDEEDGEFERERRSLSGPIEIERGGRAGLVTHHGDAVVGRKRDRANDVIPCDKTDGKGSGTNGNSAWTTSSGVLGEVAGGEAGGVVGLAAEAEGGGGGDVKEEECDVRIGSNSSAEVVEVWKTGGGRRTPRLLTPTPSTRDCSEDMESPPLHF